MTGWFGFKTPEDLLAKLERELAKLEANPSDADTAFNLFVTAWSLIDWLHPGDKTARESLRNQYPILQVCAHIADGSKHLQLNNPRHISVRGIPRGGNWAARPSQMNPGQLPVSACALFVHLEGDAATEFGSFPSALDLACRTVEWFKAYVSGPRRLPLQRDR
jgi:hypothetical protein